MTRISLLRKSKNPIKQYNMKNLLTLLLSLTISLAINAQSNDVLAQSYFLKAQEEYSEGNNSSALENLNKTVEYLNATNPKIEALFVKIFINQNDFIAAQKHLNTYFESANENSPSYNEMLRYIAVVDEKIKSKKSTPPHFPGGKEALANYLRENINYPTEAIEKNIKGRVIIGFVINKDGSISDIKIVKGIGYGCDEEAIRLVKNFPKFIPGTKEGKPTLSTFYLPINFQF